MTKKKASDYATGDRLHEADRDAGTIVSLMVDSVGSTKAFLLVRSDEGEFTIYSCLRDAISEPSLARFIPESVLQRFLFDVYFEGEKPVHTPGMETRVPVRLPEFAKRARQPQVEPGEGEPERVIPPSAVYGPAPAVREVKPEAKGEVEPVRLLPEVEFP